VTGPVCQDNKPGYGLSASAYYGHICQHNDVTTVLSKSVE